MLMRRDPEVITACKVHTHCHSVMYTIGMVVIVAGVRTHSLHHESQVSNVHAWCLMSMHCTWCFREVSSDSAQAHLWTCEL